MVTGLLLFESGVEGHQRGLEIDRPDIPAGFGRAHFAVHPAVFPFHRQGTVIADAVQRADDLLEVDASPAHAAEVPAAARVAEGGMPAENAASARGVRPPDVFHVDMVDALGESVEEVDVIHVLIAQMAGVVVET